MSKALRFLQITAEHQDCPSFTVYLTIKTSSQNISITRSQISLKRDDHRSGYWRKKLLWTILEEQFPVPRNTAASKIGNGVISLLWQLRCHCNTDHNKCSSLSNTIVVAIFPNLCVSVWPRSFFYTFLGVIDPEKLSSHLNAIIILCILEILVANFALKTKIIFHPWHHLSSLWRCLIKLPVILNISE